MKNFEELLRRHNLRITRPRREVFSILSGTSKPLSLPEICTKSNQIDRSSVYRSINTMKEIGAVKIVYIGWKELYELTDLFKPHHHHLRCTSCLELFHISDSHLEKVIEELANAHNFKITSHNFDIEGVCARCLAKSKKYPETI